MLKKVSKRVYFISIASVITLAALSGCIINLSVKLWVETTSAGIGVQIDQRAHVTYTGIGDGIITKCLLVCDYYGRLYVFDLLAVGAIKPTVPNGSVDRVVGWWSWGTDYEGVWKLHLEITLMSGDGEIGTANSPVISITIS